ncbi:transmembrane protein, putative [Medicago truncatula]|uniref:Transmembrane protein, putative n=1 Tax=Medicago truncatula TaxID=3880 RepID=G7JX70_MEDTR|nr:transmembrane protein, putative [Medicago truncatula]
MGFVRKSPWLDKPQRPTRWGLGRGLIVFGVLYAVLSCFLHKRLFPGLKPVTFQSNDNNFTSCAKVTPQL